MTHPDSGRRLRFFFETECSARGQLDDSTRSGPSQRADLGVVDINQYRIRRWLRTFENFVREQRAKDPLTGRSSTSP